MRTVVLAAVVWMSVAAGPGSAQTEKDAQTAFEQSVERQSLYLRNFSGDEKVRARVSAGGVVFDEPAMRMLAPVTVETIKLKGGTVMMTGDRTFTGNHGTVVSPVQLTVDLGGGDRTAAWRGLRGELFYATEVEARAAVSRERGGTGPESPGFNRALVAAGAGNRPTCDCADSGTPACKGKEAVDGGTPMKIIRMAQPEYSEEGRHAKVSGNVMVSFTVDSTGKSGDFWVLRPLGSGLDRQAIEAVRQSKFLAAACHANPIKEQLSMEINFQVF